MLLGNGLADLVYSTYLGGHSDSSCSYGDFAWGLALDSANNAYVAGAVDSADFPVAPTNAYQTVLNGTSDASLQSYP